MQHLEHKHASQGCPEARDPNLDDIHDLEQFRAYILRRGSECDDPSKVYWADEMAFGPINRALQGLVNNQSR